MRHSKHGYQEIINLIQLIENKSGTTPLVVFEYAGIDPMIRQSGDRDGLHLKISKKRNRKLRTILYLMAESMRKSNRSKNAVQDFYIKKTQRVNPLKPKAASIACASKLVRIIYYMHKTGSLYNYSK